MLRAVVHTLRTDTPIGNWSGRSALSICQPEPAFGPKVSVERSRPWNVPGPEQDATPPRVVLFKEKGYLPLSSRSARSTGWSMKRCCAASTASRLPATRRPVGYCGGVMAAMIPCRNSENTARAAGRREKFFVARRRSGWYPSRAERATSLAQKQSLPPPCRGRGKKKTP